MILPSTVCLPMKCGFSSYLPYLSCFKLRSLNTPLFPPQIHAQPSDCCSSNCYLGTFSHRMVVK
ncbi:hypothetical protein M758_2G011800 [Ceratodon purpureus]|nr:hypothetical protein M758_2G011800 [Ceratodon purpureus]